MRRDEDIDASSDAGLSADEAVAFETEDHLMNRRRSDAEMPLHVGFGRGLTEQARVDADEGQIVPCFSVKRCGPMRRAVPDF